MSLGFGQLFGQKEQFEDINLDAGKVWWGFFLAISWQYYNFIE